MKVLQLISTTAIVLACILAHAQESGGGSKQVITEETNSSTTIPQFHPRGFYMHFGYVFDRGGASGTYLGTGRSYSYLYHSSGASFDFGGKIFSKKKLANKFQVGGDLASTTQFCYITLFTNRLDYPYIMYWGVKAGPSFAWNFNNKRFMFLTPMIGFDYFGFAISPTHDGNSYPWEISRYNWDGAFGLSAGVKVEYVIKRFSFGTSYFYNPTFAYGTLSDVISRMQYSVFIGFKLSNPANKN